MSGSAKKLLHAAAGTAAAGGATYVENVFSTDLYIGNATNGKTINNGIDLAGEGGLVWIKDRASENHSLATTDQGLANQLASNLQNGNIAWSNMQSFDDDGFTLTNAGTTNTNTNKYVSWTFRKQTGFFDCKAVTKSSGSDLVVSFSDLGSIGFVVVKETGGSSDWYAWCKGMTSTHHIKLNSSQATSTDNYITVSGTNVTLKDGVYGSGDSIIYAWADGADSSAQIFGDDGDEQIIKTGTFTTDGSGYAAVTLGFEPQWVISKKTDGVQNWLIGDNMRGATHGTSNPILRADTNGAEQDLGQYGSNIPTATGFINNYSAGSGTFIYMAIRRGPMKEPSAGTDVFMADRAPNTSPAYVSGFPVDFGYDLQGTAGGGGTYFTSRLTGTSLLNPTSTAALANNNTYTFDFQNGMYNFESYANTGGTLYTIGHMFRRYPKVFDVVVYEGNGNNSPFRTITHNLGVAPELVIIKNIDSSSYHWGTGFNTGNSDVDGRVVYLNLDGAYNGDGLTTSATTVTLEGFGGTSAINTNGNTHLMLMFASLTGISKVGAYVGTGNDLNVTDLGAAARFVLIKRTDASGDWYVFDSVEQGIVAGNDTFQFINTSGSAATTDQDYIDPHSSGFTITSSAPDALNASGGKYLYLALS